PLSTPLVFVFTATPRLLFHTLSLHDALPILFSRYLSNQNYSFDNSQHEYPSCYLVTQCRLQYSIHTFFPKSIRSFLNLKWLFFLDRKSTRLNSSHVSISYAVFRLKKKTI